MAKKSKKSPLHTKTGKVLLGPLNVKQLTEMLEKTGKAKEKSKIISRLNTLKSRPGYKEPVVEEAVAE